MAGSPTLPLHSSPQRSPHHRPGAVPASPLTCLAPPRSPRGLRAPATPQRPRSAGLRSPRPGEPRVGLGARPLPALLPPPPAHARPQAPPPERAGIGEAGAPAQAHTETRGHWRGTELRLLTTRPGRHTEVPSAGCSGCASFLLSSGFMAGKSSTSCKERHPQRAPGPGPQSAAEVSRDRDSDRPRPGTRPGAALGGSGGFRGRGDARGLPRSARRDRVAALQPPAAGAAAPAYLDVTGIRKEHGEAIDSHAPACCRREAVLQCGAEVFINKHGFIVACSLCLNEKISDKRQGRTELDATGSTSCHQT